MFRNFSVIALLAASLVSGACNRMKSPTEPTVIEPPHTEQPPNEDSFEPLGTRHYLVDANGNPTKMWAELAEIKPLRGSRIATAPFSQAPDCSKDCYTVVIRVGVDDPSSRVAPLFQAGFVIDDVAPSKPGASFPDREMRVCSVMGPLNGSTECKAGPGAGPGGSTTYTIFEFVPGHLYLVGEYRHGTPVTATTGKTSWVTGYQPL